MNINSLFVGLLLLMNTITVSSPSWHLSFPTLGGQHIAKPLYPFLPHFFSLNELAPSLGGNTTVGLVDNNNQAQIVRHFTNSMVHHGAYMANLISGSSFSLASNAPLVVLDAFDQCGKSSKKKLIEALSDCGKCSIVCLGLKLDGTISGCDDLTVSFENLLKKIDYVVAASGNNGMNQEAYPACLVQVPFDVGAFYFDGTHASIASFSSFQKNRGPLFVMPGVNIISEGLNQNMLIQSGTSVAAAIMTATLALIVSEFKSDFNRQQILSACYCSTLKMHDTSEWHDKTVLGVLDLRLTLFILHVLRSMAKKGLLTHHHLKKDNFLSLCWAVRERLLDPVNTMAVHNFSRFISFDKEFIDYWNESIIISIGVDQKDIYSNFWKFSLEDAIEWTIDQMEIFLKTQTLSSNFLTEPALKRLYSN